MQLLPLPKTVKKQEGTLNIEKIQHLAFLGFTESEQTHLLKKAGRVFAKALTISPSPSAFRVIKADLPKQAYALTVSEEGISLKAADIEGAHFAFTTLGQLIDGREIPCVEITDEPDLSVRGVLLDISRSKVDFGNFEEIADWLEQLKYNHLELYVEGFSFEYRSFPGIGKRKLYNRPRIPGIGTVLPRPLHRSGAESKRFRPYERLVEKRRIPRFGGNSGRVFIWGAHRAPSTLNPLDPRSRELVTKMYRDMLPYSKSKYFNMNFDEPYESGQGKARIIATKWEETAFLSNTWKSSRSGSFLRQAPDDLGRCADSPSRKFGTLKQRFDFYRLGIFGRPTLYKHLKMLAEAGIDFMAAAEHPPGL